MRVILGLFAVGAVMLGLTLTAISIPAAGGSGIAAFLALAQGLGLILTGIVLAWMAAVLQELKAIRTALAGNTFAQKPAPALPQRTDPTLTAR